MIVCTGSSRENRVRLSLSKGYTFFQCFSSSHPFVNYSRMSDIGEVEENDDATSTETSNAATPCSPALRRRLTTSLGSPLVLLNDVSGLLRQYNLQEEAEDSDDNDEDEEDVEVDQEEARRKKLVVLVPRLVLEEKEVVSPAKHRKKSRASSAAVQNVAKKQQQQRGGGLLSTVPPQEAEAPPAESLEDFQRRMLDCDPLEGPSWLFGTASGKARESKLAREILERTSGRSSGRDPSSKPNEGEDKTDFDNSEKPATPVAAPTAEANVPKEGPRSGAKRKRKQQVELPNNTL